MAKHSKIVYYGETLMDLTADTIKADKLLAGYTAHGADGEPITGTCDFDANTQDATATDAEILSGKTAYNKASKVTGKMPNNGGKILEISKKDDEIIIAQGYHDGSGKARISSTEKAKLISENIRQGVTLFDVEGSMTGTEDANAQNVEVTPAKTDQTVIPDADQGYNYLAQVIVKAVPYTTSTNSAGGTTVTIG